MERTRKIRSDFQPVIAHIVSTKFKETLQHMHKVDDDYKYIRDVCWKNDGSHGVKLSMREMKSLTCGLARAYGLSHGLNRTHLRDEILQLASEAFRTNIGYLASKLHDIVKAYYPSYRHWVHMQNPSCERILLKERKDARQFALSVQYAMGLTSLRKMGVGTLLQHSLTPGIFMRDGGNGSDTTIFNNMQLSNLAQNLFGAILHSDTIEKNNTEEMEKVSLESFFAFMGPGRDTYQTLNQTTVKLNGKCDIATLRYPQPCSVSPLSECCKLEKAISSQRESVLKLMKYAVGPQTANIIDRSEIAEAISSANLFQYEMIKSKVKLESMKPAIIFCNYGNKFRKKYGKKGRRERDCTLFKKTFTMDGIGYTFNAQPFWRMLKKTKSNKAFFKQLHGIWSNTGNSSTSTDVRYPERHGITYSLEIYLLMDDHTGMKSITLHDPSTVPDTQNEAILLRPGKLHQISLVPSTVITDQSALDLSPSKRECLGRSESEDLKVFRTYSQTACLLECQLRIAIDACNCSAWNYPVLDESVSYCSVGDSTTCFNERMADLLLPDQCFCPNDCSTVQYTISNAIQPIAAFEFNYGGFYYETLLRYIVFT